jgi:signal peptidase II
MRDVAHAIRGRVSPLTLAVAGVVVVIDQLTKWWAVSTLDDRNIDLFWTLRFNLSYNTGMAFGRGRGMGPIIGVLAMVIIVALLLSLRRGSSRFVAATMGLVLGGAAGNLIDRLVRDPGWLRGAVIDFIDLQWFPIFNVADMGITVGGALLLLASWQASSAPEPTTGATAEPAAETEHP